MYSRYIAHRHLSVVYSNLLSSVADRNMKLLLSTLAIAVATASATLQVKLSHIDGTKIRASITNIDSKSYNLLSQGSIFDSSPVRKLEVTDGCKYIRITFSVALIPDAFAAYSAPFHGISKQACGQVNLSQSAFTPIAAQQTLEYDVDVVDLYDLDVGAYNVSLDGYIPYAEEGSTELTGKSLPLLSDQLSLSVNATTSSHRTELKRNTLQSDCSSSQSTAVTNANKACARMATAAAEAAESGSDSAFQEFFMDNSQSTRSQVAASFRKVAQECSSTPGGTGTSYCTDQRGECGGGLLAYTYWQDLGGDSHVGTTYYCPIYFSTLAPADGGCNDQSQASNTLHETTHAVLATRDIAYGLQNVKGLSGIQALQNADSYTYYAICESALGCL